MCVYLKTIVLRYVAVSFRCLPPLKSALTRCSLSPSIQCFQPLLFFSPFWTHTSLSPSQVTSACVNEMIKSSKITSNLGKDRHIRRHNCNSKNINCLCKDSSSPAGLWYKLVCYQHPTISLIQQHILFMHKRGIR